MDRKTFVNKLKNYTLDDLREQGRTLRYASMRHKSLRAALQYKIVEIYNVGRAADKRLDYGD